MFFKDEYCDFYVDIFIAFPYIDLINIKYMMSIYQIMTKKLLFI